MMAYGWHNEDKRRYNKATRNKRPNENNQRRNISDTHSMLNSDS
jgi:hypothetical protein